MLLRTACNSFEFEGHYVPAGATLLLATGVVHRDPGYYPSPERFDPDRHLPPRLESKPKGAFVPFGIGPHTCMGGPFAEVQMAATLAAMLHYAEFDRAPSNDRRIRVTAYPSIRPHRSCRFQVVRLRPLKEQAVTGGHLPSAR